MTLSLFRATPPGPSIQDVPDVQLRPRIPSTPMWERLPASSDRPYLRAPEVLQAHAWRHSEHGPLRATSMVWQSSGRLTHGLTVWMAGDPPRALPPAWRRAALEAFGFERARAACSANCWALSQPFRAQAVTNRQLGRAEPPLLDTALVELLRRAR